MVMAQFAMYGPQDSRTETACAKVRYYRGRKGFKKRSRDMVLKLWQANKAFCLLHCKIGKAQFSDSHRDRVGNSTQLTGECVFWGGKEGWAKASLLHVA